MSGMFSVQPLIILSLLFEQGGYAVPRHAVNVLGGLQVSWGSLWIFACCSLADVLWRAENPTPAPFAWRDAPISMFPCWESEQGILSQCQNLAVKAFPLKEKDIGDLLKVCSGSSEEHLKVTPQQLCAPAWHLTFDSGCIIIPFCCHFSRISGALPHPDVIAVQMLTGTSVAPPWKKLMFPSKSVCAAGPSLVCQLPRASVRKERAEPVSG